MTDEQLGLEGLGLRPPPAPSAPPAIVEYLSGFASHYAYGPSPTAAQRRQADQVGRELADRLAAFRHSGAA